jgi:hypothetical protein
MQTSAQAMPGHGLHKTNRGGDAKYNPGAFVELPCFRVREDFAKRIASNL